MLFCGRTCPGRREENRRRKSGRATGRLSRGAPIMWAALPVVAHSAEKLLNRHGKLVWRRTKLKDTARRVVCAWSVRCKVQAHDAGRGAAARTGGERAGRKKEVRRLQPQVTARARRLLSVGAACSQRRKRTQVLVDVHAARYKLRSSTEIRDVTVMSRRTRYPKN